MPFINFDELHKETVTPKHSTAFGELVSGARIEVGRLSFKKGEGAEIHSHPHEQIVYVLKGRLLATIDGEDRELTPGWGVHNPPNIPHGVRALEDSEIISCKSIEDGVGHRI